MAGEALEQVQRSVNRSVDRRARAPQMAPAERRRQLLEVGVSCFAGKGIGETKHADLARASSVSVPTVFSYFANRGELVTSVLSEVGSQLFERVMVPAQAYGEQRAQLRATADLFADFAREQPDHVKVWLMWSTHFGPEIQALYREFEDRLVDGLAEMIRTGAAEHDPGEDIHDRARVIIERMGAPWRVGHGHPPINENAPHRGFSTIPVGGRGDDLRARMGRK